MEKVRIFVEAETQRLGTRCGRVRCSPELGAVVVDEVDGWAARVALVAALKTAGLTVKIHSTHPTCRIVALVPEAEAEAPQPHLADKPPTDTPRT